MSHESFSDLRKLRCIVGKALSKAPQLNHNSAWVTVIHQRFCRAPDVDPVGGEDSFLKNLTDLSYYPDSEAMERDLRVCQIM